METSWIHTAAALQQEKKETSWARLHFFYSCKICWQIKHEMSRLTCADCWNTVENNTVSKLVWQLEGHMWGGYCRKRVEWPEQSQAEGLGEGGYSERWCPTPVCSVTPWRGRRTSRLSWLHNSVSLSKLESRQCEEWHSAERTRRCFSGRDADRRRLLMRRCRSHFHS